MKRFQEVSPGILRGSAPTPKDLRVLKDVWGVKRIISLDLEEGEKIESLCNQLDIEHLILPIEHNEDYSSDLRMKRTVKFLSDNIVDLLTTNQPVYIHCIHGRDRTGLAIALWRIKGEHTPEKEALAEAKSLGFGDGLSPEHLHLFLQTLKDADKEGDLGMIDLMPDIASKARGTFDPGSTTGEGTGYNYFSPIPPVQEFVMGYPKAPLPPESFAVDDKRKRKRQMRKIYFDSNDAMGYVGVNDNVNPILRYVNPGTGAFMTPEGVGPMGMLPYGNYYL